MKRRISKIKPIKIFKLAYERSRGFLGEKIQGPRAKDNLRAAVVFAVAAIDAYFRVKIIHVLRTRRALKRTSLPKSALKIVLNIIVKKLFGNRAYSSLNNDQKRAVNAMCESDNSYLINYLESSPTEMTFQNLNQLDDGMRMMDEEPLKIWGKVTSRMRKASIKRRHAGRPEKKRVGKPIDHKVQISRLFDRRHLIVHEADLYVRGKKYKGEPRPIEYGTVKQWIASTEYVIKKIDKLI